jgi:thiol-disulfide isomerase/thioredoxin
MSDRAGAVGDGVRGRVCPRWWRRRTLAGASAVGVLSTLIPVAAIAVVAGSCGGPVRGGTARATAAANGAPELRPADVADVMRAVRAPGASAVLVNVWATWCVPCREEMPDLLRVGREYRGEGLRLVLVSADFPENGGQARTFLSRLGVDFPTYLKAGSDMEFIDGLSPRWSGALPATFVFDGAGTRRDFWEGKATYDTFVARVRAVIGARAAATGGGAG